MIRWMLVSLVMGWPTAEAAPVFPIVMNLMGDINCDGVLEGPPVELTLYANGVWIDEFGDTSTWTYQQGELTLSVPIPGIFYVATRQGQRFDGVITQTGGPPLGCWAGRII